MNFSIPDNEKLKHLLTFVANLATRVALQVSRFIVLHMRPGKSRKSHIIHGYGGNGGNGGNDAVLCVAVWCDGDGGSRPSALLEFYGALFKSSSTPTRAYADRLMVPAFAAGPLTPGHCRGRGLCS